MNIAIQHFEHVHTTGNHVSDFTWPHHDKSPWDWPDAPAGFYLTYASPDYPYECEPEACTD